MQRPRLNPGFRQSGGVFKKPWTFRRRLLVAAAVGGCIAVAVVAANRGADPQEVGKLAGLLDWKAGDHIADVGAGGGDYAVAAARVVGSSGIVYVTELDTGKLDSLRDKAQKYTSLRVLRASGTSTGLPSDCCESIYLRGVYHHFTSPLQIDRDLFHALKPGGRLAVIDFAPRRLLSWFFPVRGVPQNRGGHGVPREVVTQELRDAGFTIEKQINEWPHGHYCVIARKPPGNT